MGGSEHETVSTTRVVASEIGCQHTARESSENVASSRSTAGLRSTTPTENIPEATELGTPHYKGQNVGSQWCPL